MNLINETQKKIDSTEYHDLDILDFSIKYFGDEISMVIYNDEKTSWRLTFSSCHKMEYETDASWRGIPYVRDMKKAQLGYFGQRIEVTQDSEDGSFMAVEMDLTIMTVKFSFKDMALEKVPNNELSFFWEGSTSK